MLFGCIGTLMWLVGVGTLLAGAIGVSNIMLITVKERTKEIGVRKALGARPRSIVGQILLESSILTAVAGFAGLVAGVLLLEVVARAIPSGGDSPTMFTNPGVAFETAVQALIIISVAGLFAGMIPRSARSRSNPSSRSAPNRPIPDLVTDRLPTLRKARIRP